MKNVQDLAAEGLRGEALSNALHREMFGAPSPAPNRTPSEKQEALNEFFLSLARLSPEELAQDIFAGRPTNISILDCDSKADAHIA